MVTKNPENYSSLDGVSQSLLFFGSYLVKRRTNDENIDKKGNKFTSGIDCSKFCYNRNILFVIIISDIFLFNIYLFFLIYVVRICICTNLKFGVLGFDNLRFRRSNIQQ